VETDFGLSRRQFESRIPRTANGGCESAPERVRVTIGGVDHLGVGNAEHQFFQPDPPKPIVFRQQAVVRGVVQFHERREMGSIVGDFGENTPTSRQVPRRNQTVRIDLPDE
jgi:hypothetical protein